MKTKNLKKVKEKIVFKSITKDEMHQNILWNVEACKDDQQMLKTEIYVFKWQEHILKCHHSEMFAHSV